MLGCSDSRVPAELVFGQGLGDLFVIRVAGNIVAPSQVGSVEFAVGRLVQRMIFKEGGALLAIGLVLGMVGAYGAGGIIRGLLFGVAPHDPVTFLAVALVMATIGIVACWIPALRAAGIDPAITMRSA